MTGRVVKYSEPVPFHKALPGAESVVIWKRIPHVHVAKPKRPVKPQVRLAKPDEDDDEMTRIGKVDTMTQVVDVSRGPYHAILDKMALARQAQTGESYAKAFTEVYTDPANVTLRDGAQYDHLAKAMDSIYGTAKSLVPVEKAAAPPDPLQKAAEVAEFLGPAHAKMHSLAVDHQRAHSGMTYQQAYSHLYSRLENAQLREKIRAEHMRATMARADG
jgi:hypothetical protein